MPEFILIMFEDLSPFLCPDLYLKNVNPRGLATSVLLSCDWLKDFVTRL